MSTSLRRTRYGQALERRRKDACARRAACGLHGYKPLTPTGYVVLALTLAAVSLVAMLCASPAGDEIDRVLRLSWWFA